ncbi:MAG: hypothetical protein M1821_004986 [Bathelium mastoideum]|nr:MAG: hypothetical protein M1821_004986 [Bathelium mastoideum]
MGPRKRDGATDLSDGQACDTSPINSDCNFDVRQDGRIGTFDATAYPNFDQLYASTPNMVTADDIPAHSSDDDDGVHCARGQPCKRQTAPVSLYEEILLRFQNSEDQITTAANKAYYTNTSALIYGYNDTGPSPPSGFAVCSPSVDPWTWCNSGNQPVADTSEASTLPSSSASPSGAGSATASRYITCTASSTASCPNSTFKAITAIQGSAILHHSKNGSIYSFSETNFQPSQNLTLSATFSGNEPFIVAGSKGYLLHTYNDTMTTWGVGRLRLNPPESMPVTSLPVALVPAANPLNASATEQPQSILTAVDTSARVYYLITCSYSDAYSKIFLATDLVDGPKKLLDSNLLNNVTGEVPTGCQAIGYSTGDGPL